MSAPDVKAQAEAGLLEAVRLAEAIAQFMVERGAGRIPAFTALAILLGQTAAMLDPLDPSRVLEPAIKIAQREARNAERRGAGAEA